MVMRATSQARQFWFSALMVFVVLRTADVLNAFTGLWVIPRGIAGENLGALLPLAQFGTFLALPIAILATVFTRQLCTYMTYGDRHRARGLLRDIFLFTMMALFVALGIASLTLPWVCQKLRISMSSAGYLAVIYGLLSAFLPMGISALQATKHFGALSLSSALAAPARLIGMLLLLPSLGLSGYFLGQITPLVVTCLVVFFALRPMLKGDTCPLFLWRNDCKPMTRYALWVALGSTVSAVYTMVLMLILRTQLSDSDSAGYYMISRFAEIATYCGSTLGFVLFPFAVEAKTRNETSTSLRNGVFICILLGGGGLAVLLFFLLPWLFHYVPAYQAFLPYTWHATYLTLISTLNVACVTHFQHATARNDFRYLCYTLPLTLLTTPLLLVYPWEHLLQILHLMAAFAVLQTLCVFIEIIYTKGTRL